jgi:hypothetical protein
MVIEETISIQYHALKGAEVYDRYLEDAHSSEHSDVTEFIRQCKEDERRAVRAHELLGQLTRQGSADRDDREHSGRPTRDVSASTLIPAARRAARRDCPRRGFAVTGELMACGGVDQPDGADGPRRERTASAAVPVRDRPWTSGSVDVPRGAPFDALPVACSPSRRGPRHLH